MAAVVNNGGLSLMRYPLHPGPEFPARNLALGQRSVSPHHLPPHVIRVPTIPPNHQPAIKPSFNSPPDILSRSRFLEQG